VNSAELELALRKQRLQLSGDVLRSDFGRHAAGLRPAFAVGDLAVDGAHWLRRHPELVVGVGAALIVAHPKRAWRWARRAFLAWQTWRKLHRLVDRGATPA
jgi:hypothetical protein